MKDSSRDPQRGIKTGPARPESRFYDFGPFRIDAREHALARDGQPVALTPRVFELLLLLVRNAGRLLTKEELLSSLWGDVVVEESNLAQNVFVLRKALGDANEPSPRIETVPRLGYRFAASVRASDDEPDAVPLEVGSRAPELARSVSVEMKAAAPVSEETSRPAIAPVPTRPLSAVRWLWIALVVALLAGAVWWRTRTGASEPPIFHHVGSSGHDESPDASLDGHTLAFTSDRDGRSRIWLAKLPTGAEGVLTSGPDARPRLSPDGASVLFLRDDGARGSLFRSSTLGGDARRILSDATDGDWSPDGRQIVFTRSGRESGVDWSVLAVATAEGGSPRELLRVTGNSLDSPRWSRDGELIAARKAGTSTGVFDSVLVVRADGTRKRFLTLPDPPGRISSLAWSGSGQQIVYAESDSLVSTRAGASTRIIRHDVNSGDAKVLFWIPDNVSSLDVLGPGRLVFDARSTLENLREAALLQREHSNVSGKGPLTTGRSNDRQPAYSPDGEWVVFSSDRSGNLDLWAVSTKTGAIRRITDDAADDWDPVFSRDGGKLVWCSNRGGSFEIWMADSDGSGSRQVTRDGLDAENPTPTADGRWIVYGSANPAKAGVWKIHPDGTGAVRLTAGAAVWPEVSPNGEFVAFRNAPYDFPNSGTGLVSLRVIRAADGRDTAFEIRIKDGLSAGRSRWMPDGKAIAFIAQDERGVNGVFVQEFSPGRDTSATRRPLAGFDLGSTTESFGLSPDGGRITIAARQQLSNLVIAERVPGIDRGEP